MSIIGEFKTFIAKGNVLDLAVGVIIGGAFGTIVASLTGDIIMPVVGAVFGGVDFTNYFIGLGSGITATTLDAAKEQGAVLAYGSFITAVINFLILAFIIFLIVKAANKVMEEEKVEAPVEAAPAAADIVLLTEIRDALVKKKK